MNIFGYIKVGAAALAAIAIAFLLWQAKQKDERIETLAADLATQTSNLQSALYVNGENVRLHEAALDQIKASSRIAEDELKAYKRRETEARSIINEIRKIPQEQRSPVSRIVCATVDRMYGDTETPACPD